MQQAPDLLRVKYRNGYGNSKLAKTKIIKTINKQKKYYSIGYVNEKKIRKIKNNQKISEY